jgi:hypothetical protein
VPIRDHDEADADAARAAAVSEATQGGSASRHAVTEKAARTYPLNKDERDHAPF